MLIRAGSLLATALFGFGTLARSAGTIHFTDATFNRIKTGVPFDITWAGDGTSVSIYLLNGPSNNLQTVATITPSSINSPFAWTPSTTLSPGTYALSIVQSGTTNYSPQFSISASTTSSSSTTSSTTPNPPLSTTSSISASTTSSTQSSSSTSPSTTASSSSIPSTNSPSSSATTSLLSFRSSTSAWAPSAFFVPGGHTLAPTPMHSSLPSNSSSSIPSIAIIFTSSITPHNTSTTAPFPYPHGNGTTIGNTGGPAQKTAGTTDAPVSFAGEAVRVRGWEFVMMIGLGIAGGWVGM